MTFTHLGQPRHAFPRENRIVHRHDVIDVHAGNSCDIAEPHVVATYERPFPVRFMEAGLQLPTRVRYEGEGAPEVTSTSV